MHENRETPWLTAGESGSPAGEGESRTTGMHGSGESDGAIVPMKPSNKATGQAPGAAERVEGRAPTKENVQQARAVPAQHGAAASQGLKGVRKVAKERKQERFTTLLHHLTVNLLRDSYYALKREAAPGVDGVRWAEYEDGLEPRLRDLHERVHRGSYRAQASRRIYLQKPDGRQRPIGIAALEDKIVQQAVVTILNAIYEEDFRGFSYGFRPGRSPHNALDALIVGIERKGVNWIVDADIRGFFDNMSHEWTIRFIQHRVADKRIHRLIQKWLKAGISEDGEWSETKVGTPQGAVVTPRTQKITSNLSGRRSTGISEVHLDRCLKELYLYVRWPALTTPRRRSASTWRGTCCGDRTASRRRSTNWPDHVPSLLGRPIDIFTKPSGSRCQWQWSRRRSLSRSSSRRISSSASVDTSSEAAPR